MFTKTLIASFAVAGVLTGASVLSANVASAAPNWCGHDGQPPCPDKSQGGGGKPPPGGMQPGGQPPMGGNQQQGGQPPQGGNQQGNQQQGGPPPGMPGKPKPPKGNANNNNGGIDFNITIGNGGYGGGGYGGPGWRPHHPPPPPGYYGGGGGYPPPPPPPPGYYGGYGGYGFVSCGMAKQIVRRSGFFAVSTQSCGGPVYSFTGMKKGRMFDIDVSRRGKIVNIDRAY